MRIKKDFFIGTVLVLLPAIPSAARQSLALTLETTTSLNQLIEEALRSNPEILAAHKGVGAAQARIAQASALDDPELDFESWSIPFSQPTNVNQANTHMVNLRQRVPFPGKLRLRGEIASQEAKMAAAQSRAKEREVIALVKKSYYDLFMADRSLQILTDQLEIMKQILRTAEIRYAVGKAPQPDVLKAQVEQSELLNKLIVARQERATAEARLNMLLNRSIAAAWPSPPDFVPPQRDFEREMLSQLALQSRAELQEAGAGIAQAEGSRDLAVRNQRTPDFTLGLGYWFVPQGKFEHTYSAMVTLTIPFFWTKVKHDKEVEEAGAKIAKQEATYQAIRNMTLFEVKDALAKLEAAQRTVALYSGGLIPQSEQSFKAATAAYETGKIDFLSLLEAQRSLRDTKLGYYRAAVNLEQRSAEMERAIGRDLPPQ
ncbi:MAG: TolC family protein [candidate division NC10 bacterium]|nr:TolC family protein [candidate division NC10 bacterium]